MDLTLRFALRIALIAVLLLTGAVDFTSFDLADPSAPMSDAGVWTLPCHGHNIGHDRSPLSVRAIPLLDDGCLGCGAGFAVPPVGMVPAPAACARPAGYARNRLRRRGETPRLPPRA